MMELVWQEDERGERTLELWRGSKLICKMTDVTDHRAIEQMVAAWNLGVVIEQTVARWSARGDALAPRDKGVAA